MKILGLVLEGINNKGHNEDKYLKLITCDVKKQREMVDIVLTSKNRHHLFFSRIPNTTF